MEKNEVIELSNELTYRQYLMDRGKIRELFHKMAVPEYIVLQTIASESEKSSIYEGRTYLKDLSEKMQISIRQTSKMINELKERGLILWSHDGNGSDGTYVTITENGKRMLHEQERRMKDFYGNVIQKFGKQNLIALLRLMKQLETVMSTELEEREVLKENDRVVGSD